MYPTVTSFRPPSGMRCDSRLLSSFITGALTATTVTLFLLRVVPGTYVVLPCDPTITARPVLMEEYLDRVDKQQEVFPPDSLVDTRPLHSPAVSDVFALKHRKKPHQQKHHTLKKKSKSVQQNKRIQQEHSTANNTNTVKITESKDLQQQLRDLQEKEERENTPKNVPHLMEQKLDMQHKRKLQQEQLQIRRHLNEIQMYLQQEAEETKQRHQEERQKNTRDKHRRITHAQRLFNTQNSVLLKQINDILQSNFQNKENHGTKNITNAYLTNSRVEG